jgi:quinol---cytochrome-c reductase cytochrome c subunit
VARRDDLLQARRKRGGRRPDGCRVLFLAGLFLATVFAQTAGGQVPQGKEIFESNCASCHGAEGRGTEFGPSLEQAGAASVDFQLRTGRMPLPEPGAPTLRKPPAFDDDEIDQIVAYIDSFSTGPDIPIVELSNASLPRGSELFASNCAPCHGATANGGAVGGDAFAPSLYASEPLDVAEATLVGPGQMPKFAFTDEERNAVIAYVAYLQHERDPGGLDIGGIGPVPEGFVAWAFGMVVLVIVAMLIGRDRGKGPRDDT